MGESLVLDIEEFAEKAACGADLVDFVGSVSAFGAGEMNIFTHFVASIFFFRLSKRWDAFIVAIFNGVAKGKKIKKSARLQEKRPGFQL